MSSHDGADQSGVPDGRDDAETVTEESRSLVCWVCQQPLEATRSRRFRGEPVHPDCLGE